MRLAAPPCLPCLAIWLTLATALRGGPIVYQEGPVRISATLGQRRVLLDDGQQGLKYFPDGAISVLATTPEYRVLMAAGVSSYLLHGIGMDALQVTRKVLEPGPKGAFDNGYAGIYGVYAGKLAARMLAVYHAEDQEGMGKLQGGIPGFYASVAAATSADGGATFRKMGPIVTAQFPKDSAGRADQGCGEPAILLENGGRYLYCYYTDHSRAENRGVQICLARSPLAGDGKPGTWTKFFVGEFGQPGAGGRDTPVLSAHSQDADALFPNVTYSEALGKYVMVLNVNYYRELAGPKPDKSGIYIAFSRDALNWSKPAQLVQSFSIARIGKEVAWHPTLVLKPGSLEGWLYYSYSPRWGHGEGRKPHFFVGQTIRLQVSS